MSTLFFCTIVETNLTISFIKKNTYCFTDQQSKVTEAEQSSTEEKVEKRVTFSEDEDNKAATIRNFYMMDASKEETKPNFLMGGEDGYEDIEEKDELSSMDVITKQLSDAALIDKRRRLR